MTENYDPSQLSLVDLFRGEVETQTALLNSSLLELERSPDPHAALLTLMRASHSVKGAARIVNLPTASRVAHAMEDCFSAAQRGALPLPHGAIDLLLRSTDLLAQLARRTEADLARWETDFAQEISSCLEALAALGRAGRGTPTEVVAPRPAGEAPARSPVPPVPVPPLVPRKPESPERIVRLTAESLNRLLGLAGESLVESRWLRPFTDSLQKLKRQHISIQQRFDDLRDSVAQELLPGPAQAQLQELAKLLSDSRQFLTDRLQELDSFDRRSAQLSHRLYLEVLRTRMRPFGDGVRRFPRMVRDLARLLDKEVRLEVTGDLTQVDREILERLETPLAHLLRNAVDHGCESRDQRAAAGKPPENLIRLEARHSAGILIVSVSDDGCGVDVEQVRRVIVERGLAPPAQVETLADADLLEFLFLPGFTLRDTVTEISGRGVGLDVVQNMVRGVRGSIRVSNQPGRGLRVQLQLPLTLSVLRAMLVEVDEEPYAIPLSQIHRTMKVSSDNIEPSGGRWRFQLDGQPVSLVSARRVLECGPDDLLPPAVPVVVLGDRATRHGLIVDRFLGERELVVQPLDGRLGKIRDISAAALMEDGNPVLVLDVEDLLKSMDRFTSLMPPVVRKAIPPPVTPSRRILAVDDSPVVRELIRKLLTDRGYLTDVANDGKDAWAAMHTRRYDLVITDVEMPGLDGVGLAALMKRDPVLRGVPILVVSCKDAEVDRVRGIQAGADSYLGKGAFTDEALLGAVASLIGPAQPPPQNALGSGGLPAQNRANPVIQEQT